MSAWGWADIRAVVCVYRVSLGMSVCLASLTAILGISNHTDVSLRLQRGLTSDRKLGAMYKLRHFFFRCS